MLKGMERLAMDGRLEWVRVAVLCVMFALLGGLGYFQLVKGDSYVELATGNRLRIIRLLPPRGLITDANGAPMAVNVRTFDMKGYPMDIMQEENVTKLASIMQRHGIPLTETELKSRIEKQYVAPYRAVDVATNLTLTQMADLVSDLDSFGLIFPVPVWRRVYPAGSLVSHVIGYVGEITAEELENAHVRYQGGDMIGKTGVEAWYEERLRGEVGEEAVEVDSRGRKLRDVGRKEPLKGNELRLTLDMGAQRVAAELMGSEKGAVVAMDVHNGGIKVLYSSPSFDTNPLTWGIASKEWMGLIKDPARPMMNRAIGGTYPPASTFKLITSIAALEENTVTARTVVHCPGYFEIGDRKFRCWRHSGHGTMNMATALNNSCDVYFYQVGVWMGSDKLVKWASRLGVGALSGIDLPGEAVGNLAGREWKKRRFKESWYTGDTVNYSIGQGFLLMTPLQIARSYAAVANGGYMVTPHLSIDGEFERTPLNIPDSGLKAMQRGLADIVRIGTGRRAGIYGVTVAGKTGTAQNPHGEDHAWFVGYAPVESPRYVVAVLVEGGGSGGAVTAPLVGQILAFLVNHDKKGAGI